MSRLKQPYRGLFALTELLQKTRLAPGIHDALAKPDTARQESGPPFWMTRPGDRSVRTRDEVIATRAGTTRVRVFTPTAQRAGDPVIVYLHGGGFVEGGLRGADYITRGLAARTGLTVVSVEYRLAPECAFPGPLEDCEDALRWVVQTCPDGVDGARVALGGDSAGGNLAAALCLLLRDTGGPAVVHQTLIYPFTDARITSPSWDEHERAGVGRSAGQRMVELYAPQAAVDDPYLSPLLAKDLSGLPPALVVLAEVDVLHEDGKGYAAALRAAGNDVVLKEWSGVPHGFLTMPRLGRASDEALDLIGSEVLMALRT